MATIQLGQKVRDSITGLEGIVVCRAEWLYGCVRITVQPQEVKDGKPVDMYTFDEPQAVVLEASGQGEVEPNHGPRPEPVRPQAPRR